MGGALTPEAISKILNHLHGTPCSATSSIYFCLSHTIINQIGGNIEEPTNAEYTHQSVSFVYDPLNSRSICEDRLVFPFTENWVAPTAETNYCYSWFLENASGENLAFGMWDSSQNDLDTTYENLPYVDLGESLSTGDYTPLVISKNDIYISSVTTIDSGYSFSPYSLRSLMSHLFCGVSFASPDTYVALLSSTTISDPDLASGFTEVTGTGYERKQVNPYGGASPSWNLAVSGELSNADQISWSVGGSDWDTVVGIAVMDAATDGNVLYWNFSDIVDFTPVSGKNIIFNSGTLVCVI